MILGDPAILKRVFVQKSQSDVFFQSGTVVLFFSLSNNTPKSLQRAGVTEYWKVSLDNLTDLLF